jgi:hypothetical protein
LAASNHIGGIGSRHLNPRLSLRGGEAAQPRISSRPANCSDAAGSPSGHGRGSRGRPGGPPEATEAGCSTESERGGDAFRSPSLRMTCSGYSSAGSNPRTHPASRIATELRRVSKSCPAPRPAREEPARRSRSSFHSQKVLRSSTLPFVYRSTEEPIRCRGPFLQSKPPGRGVR